MLYELSIICSQWPLIWSALPQKAINNTNCSLW